MPWAAGDRVEAYNETYATWYSATIVAVAENERALVHYFGWNKRLDELVRWEHVRLPVQGHCAAQLTPPKGAPVAGAVFTPQKGAPAGAVFHKAVLWDDVWRSPLAPSTEKVRPLWSVWLGDVWRVRWADRTDSDMEPDEVRDCAETERSLASAAAAAAKAAAKAAKAAAERARTPPAKKPSAKAKPTPRPAPKRDVVPPPTQRPARAPKRTKVTDEPADASETSSIAPLVSYLERLDGCDDGAKAAAGWTVTIKTRREGATAGTTDKYYLSPVGRQFRSMADVARHLDLIPLWSRSGDSRSSKIGRMPRAPRNLRESVDGGVISPSVSKKKRVRLAVGGLLLPTCFDGQTQAACEYGNGQLSATIRRVRLGGPRWW